jgi:hypothetical protein
VRKQLPISDAAQLAGVSVNDLLNLAASDQIYLGAMLDPFIADGRDYAGRELKHEHLRELRAKTETCILPHEAKEILLSGTATVRVWREPGHVDGVSIPQLSDTPVVYFLREHQKIGRDVLWVYEDELSLHYRGAVEATAPAPTVGWQDIDCDEIDGDSGIRHSPDDRNQFLQAAPKPGDIEMLFSSWSVDTATQLIAIGCTIDSPSGYEKLKNLPGIANVYSRASFIEAVAEALRIARRIAESSIKIGDIKEHDTPSNWLLWAESKKYDVKHLRAILAPAFAVISEQGNMPKTPWNEDKLRKLLNEHNAGATQGKLAKKHMVSRQFIGEMLKKAKGDTGLKKATPFGALFPGNRKK